MDEGKNIDEGPFDDRIGWSFFGDINFFIMFWKSQI
jgi:hypothetical protein